MKKRAECVRQTENWAVMETYHKMDNKAFNPEKVKEELPIISPKMQKMLENIEKLDADDKETHGKLFKHMIFSDLKSIGGAKSVGSALLSHGYNIIYDDNLEVAQPILKGDKNFAVLCSTKIYNKDVGVRFTRKILDIYNKRPDNVYGENVRFIVLDFGFKEGIDLFDIKYIHIIETPVTKADQAQIIGRGTRFCGQKMLNFDKVSGWSLNVYIYNATIPLINFKKAEAEEKKKKEKKSQKAEQEPEQEPKAPKGKKPKVEGGEGNEEVISLYDIFLEYSNIDSLKHNFANELEKRCIQGAVDFELNKNIHTHGKVPESDFMILSKEVSLLIKDLDIDGNNAKHESVRVHGQQLEMNGDFDCYKGCKKNAELIPNEIMLIAWYCHKHKMYETDYVLEKYPKPILCWNLLDHPDFCKTLKEIWKKPSKYILDNSPKLLKRIGSIITTHPLMKKQVDDMTKYIDKIINNANIIELPPTKIMNFLEMYQFIMTYYKHLKWNKLVMENLCIEEKKKPIAKPLNEETFINIEKEVKPPAPFNKVEFGQSQKFLQAYFTPQSIYKGMLVWHSTGTGKTCTGISVATNAFEKAGYTILWVTRTTLKGDIWKNMFRQVCSVVIHENNQAFDVEDAMKNPKKYMGNNWIEPITYRQFSNLLLGKNEYYAEMVKRNGAEDPLKKTLIIIDEAHKLLSADLLPAEKPNFEVLHKKITSSYEISKKDSVKVFLMTATPYTDDPMQMVRLLNLLRPITNQLPEKFPDFKKMYLAEDGTFKEPTKFLTDIAGYISYLNRSADMRQFAYPIIRRITVPISMNKPSNIIEQQTELDKSLQLIAESETGIVDIKERVKADIEEFKTNVVGKNKAERDRQVKEYRDIEIPKRDTIIKEFEETIKEHKEKVKILQSNIKDINLEIMNYPSQEKILAEKCLKA